jgi:hypothetical protein
MLACLFLSRLVPHPAEDISSRSIRCFFWSLYPVPRSFSLPIATCVIVKGKKQPGQAPAR